MKFILPLICCSLALVFSLPARTADLKLEVIPLHYRNVDEIIPIIRPVIGTGGTVTGMNNQLIIRATPEDIAAIRELLGKIDKRPRRLMITVTHDISEETGKSQHSITGSYASGKLGISTGSASERDSGGDISLQGQEGGQMRYRLDSNRSMRTDNSDIRVQTLEGQPAFIASGSQVPLNNRTAYRTGRGVIVQDTVVYHDASTGFYVIPRLSGDVVTLSISPFMTKINPDRSGSFKIENIETTVQGHLGEWIEVGGYHQQSQQEHHGLLSENRRQQDRSHATYLKVEELP